MVLTLALVTDSRIRRLQTHSHDHCIFPRPRRSSSTASNLLVRTLEGRRDKEQEHLCAGQNVHPIQTRKKIDTVSGIKLLIRETKRSAEDGPLRNVRERTRGTGPEVVACHPVGDLSADVATLTTDMISDLSPPPGFSAARNFEIPPRHMVVVCRRIVEDVCCEIRRSGREWTSLLV
jgi:hypothetical protein